MDGQRNHRSDDTAAIIVRQFTASRIERQLLAQIFDLVCGSQSGSDECVPAGQNTGQKHLANAVIDVTDSSSARRRAA
jgi:hypothetical protein